MSNKFTFKDDVQLNINGVEFSFDSTDLEFIAKLEEFSREAQEFGNAMSKREDYVEALKESIEFCCNTIDTLLGEGASEKIFKGTKVSLIKAMDVINYISDEVGKARADSMTKYSPNRAQRRSK